MNTYFALMLVPVLAHWLDRWFECGVRLEPHDQCPRRRFVRGLLGGRPFIRVALPSWDYRYDIDADAYAWGQRVFVWQSGRGAFMFFSFRHGAA